MTPFVIASFQDFFQRNKCIKKCTKYQKKLHRVATDSVENLAYDSKEDVSIFLDFDEQARSFCAEVNQRQKQLEDLNRKWKSFETLLESTTAWMDKAESLMLEGGINACKVRCVLVFKPWPNGCHMLVQCCTHMLRAFGHHVAQCCVRLASAAQHVAT